MKETIRLVIRQAVVTFATLAAITAQAQNMPPGTDPDPLDAGREPFGFPTDVVIPYLDTAPVIDGQIGAGEWADAVQFDITLGGAPVILYLGLDGGDLLLAIDDQNDPTLEAGDQMFMYFDDEGGISHEISDQQWTAATCPSTEGEYIWGSFLTAVQYRGWALGPTGCSFDDALAEGSTALSDSAGNVQYESRISLSAGHLVVSPGQVLGLWIGTFSSTTLFSGGTGNPADRRDPATYSRFTIGPAPAAPDSLVGLWRFNEGAGVATLDFSGSSADGAITDALWEFDDTDWTRGTSLRFDGLGDFVHVDDPVAEFGTADFTIAGWFEVTAGNAGAGLLKGDGDVNWEQGEKQFWFGDGSNCCSPDGETPSFVGHSNEFLISNASLPTTGWHHVAVTWDHLSFTDGTGRIFLDGIETGFFTSDYAANFSDNIGDTFYIGLDGSFEAQHDFLGRLDDIAVFKAALSPGQVTTIMSGDFSEFVDQATHIYWSDQQSGEIRRANLDGSAMETVVAGLNFPSGVAVDTAAGKLYWTNWFGSDNVQRANLDGTGIETLVVDNNANVIAVDANRGKMFWTNFSDGDVKRADLDGSNVEVIFTGGNPEGIAVDVVTGLIYWADASSGIRRAESDGSNPVLLVNTGPRQLRQVSLAPETGRIFWTDWAFDGGILHADLNGLDVQTILVGEIWGAVPSVFHDKVFIADYTNDTLGRMNLNGSVSGNLLTGQSGPLYIALDAPAQPILPLFADDFELGDLSVWSSSVP